MNNHRIQRQMTGSVSESSTVVENPLPNYRTYSPVGPFLRVPLQDDRIEELLEGNIKPENLIRLKKLAEDCPNQWSPRSIINSLEKLCDSSMYNHTANDTVVILELHLRCFAAVLETLIQNPVILNCKLREKLYKQLTEFNNIHHNVSVVMEEGLNKTWKGKLQHLNVADVELQTGGVKRNYNIDFLLIHLRDTLHSLSDDETRFREGWRRFKEFFKGVLGITPAIAAYSAVPGGGGFADNANLMTSWTRMREAFGFKVPVSNWYKDWRLLLMLKQTLDSSYQEAEVGNQNLKKFGERMLLEYLWFHVQRITSQIVPSKNEDFEFSKIFNNKKRLFGELAEIEPLSYPHTLWFGILDLAGSVCDTSTKSITLSLCYYLALESLNHAPSTFIRFKAIELLLSLEHRRRDWFAVVTVDLEEYANQFGKKKSKFFSLLDYVKYKLVLKDKIMKGPKTFSKLNDDFPAFTTNSTSQSNSILSLLAQELLCPVTLQITDQFYALDCGHIISKGAFNIYKAVQNKKGRELTCSICRKGIKESSLTLLPQSSTLNALSDRLVAAGLFSNENATSEYEEIISNPDTVVTDIKKPIESMSDVISRQLTSPADPPDPVQCARECYVSNPQKALLILDKTLNQDKANHPLALLERAKIYDHLQRYGEALYDVNKSIQYEDNIEAYQLRAHLHFKMKNYKVSYNDISIVLNRVESYKTENEKNEKYQYSSTDLDAYLLRGRICMKLGCFYNEAISDFSVVLENDINFLAWASRGALFRELRKYEEALGDLTRAIQYNPNYMFAIAQRGSVYCKLDKIPEAFDDLNEVINGTASEEDRLFAAAERGDLFCKQNKFYEALCDLESVLEQDPSNIFARSRRGYALFMLKKYDESLQCLNQVLALDKTNYYALTYRGIIYKQQNDYKNGLKDFNAVLMRFPNNPIVLRQRGAMYYAVGKYEESLHDFEKLINLDKNKNDVHALCYRADILCELGSYKDCLEDCSAILQFDSSNLNALRIRGMVLRKFGQNGKALVDLDKVLLQQPENAAALHERAAVYTALHQYQRALADCEKILYLKNEESISSFQERTKVYGELSEAIGVEEILIHLERVLQDDPKNPLVLTTRAYIHLLQWDCDKAVDDLNSALGYKLNILSLYQRSVIYRITQKYNQALKDLEKILELEPGNNFAQTEKAEIENIKDFDRNQLHTPNRHPNQPNNQPPTNRAYHRLSESSLSSSRSSNTSASTSERSRTRRTSSVRQQQGWSGWTNSASPQHNAQ